MNIRNALKRVVRRFGRSDHGRAHSRVPQRKTVWSIGIYSGRSLADFKAPDGLVNPVLSRTDVTDVVASFVADPFMVQADGTWYMFFEVYNRERGAGEIGLATSVNGVQWSYRQIVLREPFHLSYPHVFQWQGERYMIPESRSTNEVRLYRASHFPNQWELVQTLLQGRFADASIFQYEGKWWLFVDSKEGLQVLHDTLRLYSSESLFGPWTEHPRSPIVAKDPHIARPGGRVVVEKTPVRFTQDCYPFYGTQLRAFEITRLTPTEYEEIPLSSVPVLRPGGHEWNEAGMHHIDPHRLPDGGWIACVDGFKWE